MARDRATEPSLEDEGIPDLEGPLEAKRATGDGQEGVTPPRDRPVAATKFGTTAEEQRTREPLEMRLDQEEPDPAAGAQDPGVWADGQDEGGGEHKEAEGAVRLIDPDAAREDHEPALVGEAAENEPAMSAEESAVRVIDEDAAEA